MTDQRLETLRLRLEQTPEKNWQSILDEFEGKTSKIKLTDVIEECPGQRFYYKDFVKHLEEHEIDLGFKLGKAASKVASLLSNILGVSVESIKDTSRGVYLSNIAAGFPKVNESFVRTPEMNRVIREARENRFQYYLTKGLSPSEALDRAEGNLDAITERMKIDFKRISDLKADVKRRHTSIVKGLEKDKWMGGHISVSSMLSNIIFRGIIESDEIYHELKQSELWSIHNIGCHKPNWIVLRRLEIIDPHICKYVIAEAYNITIEQVYALYENYTLEDLDHIYSKHFGKAPDKDFSYKFVNILDLLLENQSKNNSNLLPEAAGSKLMLPGKP